MRLQKLAMIYRFVFFVLLRDKLNLFFVYEPMTTLKYGMFYMYQCAKNNREGK